MILEPTIEILDGALENSKKLVDRQIEYYYSKRCNDCGEGIKQDKVKLVISRFALSKRSNTFLAFTLCDNHSERYFKKDNVWNDYILTEKEIFYLRTFL